MARDKEPEDRGSGWRGPGEGPGYREARKRTQTFQQSSTGGQIPGEYRQWRSDQRPELASRGRSDTGERGPHAGRGPKNYRRSDDRIREELCDRLTAHPEIDASEIEVEVKEAHVVLRGSVPDRRTKHRAEDLAERVLGALDIDNQLRVRRSEGPAREQH
ncbi:MAG TPA: BON domain-containing protein [Thermoanaerobaculia bacterium]|nr:BON domain-containing protein [Thermoanaerobaculia bacterium]